MRTNLRQIGLHLTITATLCVATACETSSHKSVRTYDYNDEGRAPHTAPDEGDRGEREEQDSDYHMVSPGEMAAPGRPVVDPKP